ncbi:hypothetical protein MMC25_005131 [Agyrium rufum]|nr:hypothetical protein [Agyrium rufum]
MSQSNPFLLAADNAPSLLLLLRSKPSLASSQDQHGYSLLHAAASYNHLDLLRTLITEFHVDVNLKDEDGETALFVVETVEAAKLLVEDLKLDGNIINEEGMTAEEKIRGEGDFVAVADYLGVVSRQSTDGAEPDASSTSTLASATITNGAQVSQQEGMPSLPANMTLNVGTAEVPDQEVADPEFRRRIEELAQRDDFTAEEGQRQLRELVQDAVRGVDGTSAEREWKKR